MRANVNYEKLDDLLFQRGLSRRKLARAIGVSPETIAGSFRRNSKMSVPQIIRIASALNVSASLFSDIDDSKECVAEIDIIDTVMAKLMRLNGEGVQEIDHMIDVLLKAEEYRRNDHD